MNNTDKQVRLRQSLHRNISALLAVQHLKRLSGRQHVLLTARAATGIWAILRVFGFHNRWIGIPANTCYIVLWAVLHSGNKPFLIDVDPRAGNISLDTLGVGSSPPLAAIIPCHMYGLAAPMSEMTEWAAMQGVPVIEDSAQSIGTLVDGKAVGSWGDVSVFSFGQGKIVDVGGGGALLTDNSYLAGEVEKLLAELDMWSDHHVQLADQWNQIYWALHQFESQNPRLLHLYPQLFEMYKGLVTYRLPVSFWNDLPEILDELPMNLQQRVQVAAIYDEGLRDLPVKTLQRRIDMALWRYPLLVSPEHRNDLLRHLWQAGFYDVTRWYPSLRYMLAVLSPDVPVPITPGADRLGEEIVNLPLSDHPHEARRLVEAIHVYFENGT